MPARCYRCRQPVEGWHTWCPACHAAVLAELHARQQITPGEQSSTDETRDVTGYGCSCKAPPPKRITPDDCGSLQGYWDNVVRNYEDTNAHS